METETPEAIQKIIDDIQQQYSVIKTIAKAHHLEHVLESNVLPFGVTRQKDHIVLVFPEKIEWISLPIEAAEKLAINLLMLTKLQDFETVINLGKILSQYQQNEDDKTKLN